MSKDDFLDEYFWFYLKKLYMYIIFILLIVYLPIYIWYLKYI
jgi:hypothetical protein